MQEERQNLEGLVQAINAELAKENKGLEATQIVEGDSENVKSLIATLKVLKENGVLSYSSMGDENQKVPFGKETLNNYFDENLEKIAEAQHGGFSNFISNKNTANLSTFLEALNKDICAYKENHPELEIFSLYNAAIMPEGEDRVIDPKEAKNSFVGKFDTSLGTKATACFDALHSHYGDKKIEDSGQSIQAAPTLWEKVKDFLYAIITLGQGQTLSGHKKSFQEMLKSSQEQKQGAAIAPQ